MGAALAISTDLHLWNTYFGVIPLTFPLSLFLLSVSSQSIWEPLWKVSFSNMLTSSFFFLMTTLFGLVSGETYLQYSSDSRTPNTIMSYIRICVSLVKWRFWPNSVTAGKCEEVSIMIHLQVTNNSFSEIVATVKTAGNMSPCTHDTRPLPTVLMTGV